MASKKPTGDDAALDAQLFAMMTAVGAVEVDAEEPPQKPAAQPPKPNGSAWGSKQK